MEEVNQQLIKISEESNKSRESLSSHQRQIKQYQLEVESLIREATESEKVLSLNQDEYEALTTQTRELDDDVSEERYTLNEYKSQINEAQLKLDQLHMKSQYLVDQIQEKYMINLKESCHEYKEVEGDAKSIESELEDFKAKLKRIGEVNSRLLKSTTTSSTVTNFISPTPRSHRSQGSTQKSYRKNQSHLCETLQRNF